ncbi:MAG: indole-3-glycerol-phosphate synthase TrpC, partial [Cytophagaceae bacterium]
GEAFMKTDDPAKALANLVTQYSINNTLSI